MKFLPAALFSLVCVVAVAREPAPAPSAVKIPDINFKHSKLDNGLEVYTVEDHSSPTVAVQVWYHVGSKDDPQGRSGFAHLFEHMMFKGNEHLSPDAFEELTENVGGENNAYTQNDVTVYHEVVPSNYLEPILWAEAERMSSLALNDKNFGSERDVVKEEYRQRIAANPYGEFGLAIPKLSYSAHPYKRPTIGSIEELDASKLPEVQAFHSTFYRPDNATLVVVGDFDPKQLDAWTTKYLGAVKKPPGEIPRVTTKEPPRQQDRREVIYSTKAPLPAVAITYLAPSIRSEDSAALDVADEILSGGASSRLYQSLIYQQQIAQQASFDADLNEDVGLLRFTVVLASGKTVADAEKAVDQQIDDILKNGVTDAEVAKAKNRFVTGKLFGLETSNGKASVLGEAAVVLGDPNRVNTELKKLQAVTPEQVKVTLNKYVAGKKRLVIEYLPEAMRVSAPNDPKPE
jgi:zinc protease